MIKTFTTSKLLCKFVFVNRIVTKMFSKFSFTSKALQTYLIEEGYCLTCLILSSDRRARKISM